MARTRKTTGLAADATMIVAFDDDGQTFREWVNGWSSVTTDGGLSWTNNDAANMTVDGGAVTGTGTWKGVSQTYLQTAFNGSFDFFGVTFPTALGAETVPASVSLFGALMGNSAGNNKYWLSSNAGAFYGFGPASSSATVAGSPAVEVAAIEKAPGSTAVPSNGTTKFSVGANIDSNNQVEAFYGLESGSLASDGSSVEGDLAWQGIGSIGGEGGQDLIAPHKFVLWAQFNRPLTELEMQSLHNDPFGTLFESLVDTTDPTLSSTTPADGATGVAVTANPTATFSEAIAFGTGNITLRNVTDGLDIEVFDVTTNVGGGAGTVSISTDTLTIEPTSDLPVGKEIAVRIDATAIDDSVGNSYAGIADDTTWNFGTVSVSSITMTLRTKVGGNPVASADISYAIRNSGTALSAAADVSGQATTDASGGITITAASLVGPVDVTLEVTSGTYAGQTLHAESLALN